MSIIRIGSTKKYAQNWEQAFGKKKKTRSATTAKSKGKKATAKKNR